MADYRTLRTIYHKKYCNETVVCPHKLFRCGIAHVERYGWFVNHIKDGTPTHAEIPPIFNECDPEQLMSM